MKELKLEIPEWILKRRIQFKTKLSITSPGMMVNIAPLDVDGTPATFISKIKPKVASIRVVDETTKTHEQNSKTITSEPFNIMINEKDEPGTFKLKLELEFMGHYNEPVLNMEYELPTDSTSKLEDWLLLYNPMTGIWKTETFSDRISGKDEKEAVID